MSLNRNYSYLVSVVSRNLFYLSCICYMTTFISYDITTQRSKVVRFDELNLSFVTKLRARRT